MKPRVSKIPGCHVRVGCCGLTPGNWVGRLGYYPVPVRLDSPVSGEAKVRTGSACISASSRRWIGLPCEIGLIAGVASLGLRYSRAWLGARF